MYIVQPQVCPCIGKGLGAKTMIIPYPGENAGVCSYDGGEGLHASGSHMHCWFIQHAQQLQRKNEYNTPIDVMKRSEDTKLVKQCQI